MTEPTRHEHAGTPASASPRRRRLSRGEWLLVALLVSCLGAVAGVARWAELRRPPQGPAAAISEELYVSPAVARRMSLGFNGLAADWYWLRTLQYVGRKVTAHEGKIQIDDLSSLNLKILAPLLDNATTLDPQFMAAYQYGAVVLPAVDKDEAIRLVKKGIDANPKAWRLYASLGYIYWQQNRFPEASEAYAAGSRVEGAPAYLRAMAAQMSAKGGSRETARAIYDTMLRTTDDEQMRALAHKRLQQLQSLDEMDSLRRLLTAVRDRSAGRCPEDWREIAPVLRAARVPLDAGTAAPLDPSHKPYKLVAGKCEVELGDDTEVIRSY